MMWKLAHNSTGAVIELNNSPGAGLKACLRQLKRLFPQIKLGVCGSADLSSLNVVAANPEAYAAAMRDAAPLLAPPRPY